MLQHVAILEDSVDRQREMLRLLPGALPGCIPILFDDATTMIGWLRQHQPDVCLICLDHDLPATRRADGASMDSGSGRQVAEYLTSVPVTCPVMVHTSNAPAGYSMVEMLRAAGWSVSRVVPHDHLDWIAADWVQGVSEFVQRGFIRCEEPAARHKPPAATIIQSRK